MGRMGKWKLYREEQMGLETEISWADATLNLWWGCVEVSILCDHCYAREWSKRYDRAVWGANEPRVAVKGAWTLVEKLQRQGAAAGTILRVFCGSMMDIFEKPMPLADSNHRPMEGTTEDLRQRLCVDVVPKCPNLLFLFLTKRPGSIGKYIPESWRSGAPPNVMFGTSIGNQETADNAVPKLIEAPGLRFLSCEPLLGPMILRDEWMPHIHWIIGGGESGPKARPCHPMWAKSLRDQAVKNKIPFHWKQWGEFAPLESVYDADKIAHDRIPRFTPVSSGIAMDEPAAVFRVGKNAAGRYLDGRIWDQMPEAAR